MTGYTVHTGASKKFVSGWDRVFSVQSENKAQAKKSGDSSAKKNKGAASAKKKKK